MHDRRCGAGELYLAAMFPSKRQVLGLDVTVFLDWKFFGSVRFVGGGVLMPGGGWGSLPFIRVIKESETKSNLQ